MDPLLHFVSLSLDSVLLQALKEEVSQLSPWPQDEVSCRDLSYLTDNDVELFLEELAASGKNLLPPLHCCTHSLW